jgi:hypothetical protein
MISCPRTHGLRRRTRRGILGRALLALAAASSSAGAVVGPTTAGAAFGDNMVMILRHAGQGTGVCSGLVLASNVILTAAHCVGAAADLRVALPGEGGPAALLRPDAVAVHPGYRADARESRKVSIDLALIHLGKGLPATFRPLALADSGGAEIGTPVRIVGFGIGEENAAATPGRLRLGGAAVQPPRSAVLLWASAPDGTGACAGDSGGGIFAARAPILLAVIAWAEGEHGAHCGALTQATWVAPHRAWIAATRARWAKPGDF